MEVGPIEETIHKETILGNGMEMEVTVNKRGIFRNPFKRPSVG